MGFTAQLETKGNLRDDIILVNIPLPPDDAWISKIENKYPGLKVRWVQRAPLHSQDKGIAADQWDDVTMVICSATPPAELMSKVRYVQLSSAGADRWLEHKVYNNKDVIFCNASGCHPPQIAEWVIGTWLMMSHRLLDYYNFQREGRWNKVLYPDIIDSPGLRMGILGYGAIGRHVARIARAMGMEIYAYTRSERSTPESRKDESYCVPGTGDPDGLIPTKWFHGASQEAVNEFLGQDLDVLVICLPLTGTTKNLIGQDQFDILSKKKTFVSNIGRGKLIEPTALLDALQQGKIRGAALDVTEPEPLPEGHALFKAANVYISPHVSWQTPYYWDRLLAITEINLDRMNDGKPMINVMNREHHY